MSLYVSINDASSTLTESPINDAIRFIAAHANIEKRQGQMPDGPSLDVTFFLPDEHDIPPFSGLRMGNYTLESDTLFFETAVPGHVLKSDKAPGYIAVVMQGIVEYALEFFQHNQIEFDVNHWRQTMTKLTAASVNNETVH